MIVNDTTGRTPEELAGGYAEAGGLIPVDAGAIAPEDLAVLVMEGGAGFTLVEQPAGATDYGLARPRYDVTRYRGIRLTADVLEAGAAGAVLKAYYKTPAGAEWLPVGNPDTAAVSLAATGEVAGASVPLVASCTGDVRFLVRASGGDGAASPSIRRVAVQLLDLPQRVEDPVAPTCEVYADSMWHEDWSGWASVAALDAASDVAAEGTFLRTLGLPAALVDDEIIIDPEKTFCGHPTLRGQMKVGAQGGWSSEWYFAPYPDYTPGEAWPGDWPAAILGRSTWWFPVGAVPQNRQPLADVVFEGDGGDRTTLSVGPDGLDAASFAAIDSGDPDGGVHEAGVVAPLSALFAGGYVDVLTHAVHHGTSTTTRFYIGPTGGPYTLLATVTRSSLFDVGTRVIALMMNLDNLGSASGTHNFWCGRCEVARPGESLYDTLVPTLPSA